MRSRQRAINSAGFFEPDGDMLMFMRWLLPLFTTVALSGQVTITQLENRIAVAIDGKPYTQLFYGPDVTKPYLHPLRAASGTIVTRGYPMEKIPGESADHPHHRGLWFGHGDVNGADFWANEPMYKKNKLGRIAMKSVDKITSGKESGSIDTTFEWFDVPGHAIMTEKRRMTFYRGDKTRTIDFDITLTPIVRVVFGDTKEGTFAMRLAAGLETKEKDSLPQPPRTGQMVNSEGKTGEAECWGKRADWMDYHGELAGEKVGIAILDHPENPRHPTYWHTRGYGLYAANIFGLHDFLSDSKADGSMIVEPGKPVRFRYRVIIHPGDEKDARIADLYNAYSSH